MTCWRVLCFFYLYFFFTLNRVKVHIALIFMQTHFFTHLPTYYYSIHSWYSNYILVNLVKSIEFTNKNFDTNIGENNSSGRNFSWFGYTCHCTKYSYKKTKQIKNKMCLWNTNAPDNGQFQRRSRSQGIISRYQ